MDEVYMSGAALADALGVTRSAISNWIKRGVLPDELAPVYPVKNGDPQFREELLPQYVEWFAPRRKRGPAGPRVVGPRAIRDWDAAVKFAFTDGHEKPEIAMARLITAGAALLQRNQEPETGEEDDESQEN